MKKLSNTELKKALLIKKLCILFDIMSKRSFFEIFFNGASEQYRYVKSKRH